MTLRGIVVFACVSWILPWKVLVDSTAIPVPGSLYNRDDSFINQIPSDVDGGHVNSLAHCSMLCKSKSGSGFFYNNDTRVCVVVEKAFSTYQMVNAQNVLYYRLHDSQHTTQITNGVSTLPTIKTTPDTTVQTTHADFPFTRDLSMDDQLPNDLHPHNPGGKTLTECGNVCSSVDCIGFFFDSAHGVCFTVGRKFLTKFQNVRGMAYYRKLGLYLSTDDKLSKNLQPKIPGGKTLAECGNVCSSDDCVGFDSAHGVCFTVGKKFLTTFQNVPGMAYYRKLVTKGSRLISLDYNVCPEIQAGIRILHLSNGDDYELSIDLNPVTQAQAAMRCQMIGKQLLRMKGEKQYECIKGLLQCPVFAGKYIWTGAERKVSTWKFPDQGVLNSSYFCRGEPSNPSFQHCVQFSRGCLDDIECHRKAGVICD